MSYIKSFLPNEAIQTVIGNLPSMVGYCGQGLTKTIVIKSLMEKLVWRWCKYVSGKHIREVNGGTNYIT